MKAAGAWRERGYNPRPPLCGLSCACFQASTEMSRPVHLFINNIVLYYYTYTLQTKGLIYDKFYGSSTDDPARDRSAHALACIKVRLSLPYNRQVAWDLKQFPLVARREARRDKVCMASAPQHP